MRLVHGTTYQRALKIVQNGPNMYFVEPGGTYGDPAGGISTYIADHTSPDGAAVEDYARGKARIFPNEGGAAIIEIEVPVEIVDISRNDVIGRVYFEDTGEIRFEPGMGLEELIAAWPNLEKRVIQL